MLNTNHERPGAARKRAAMWRLSAAAVLGALLLNGCAQTGQFISIGDQSSHYNRELLSMSLWPIALSVLIFTGVAGALFYTVSRFREENNQAAPAQFHGNNRLEGLLVLIPTVIVIGLSVLAVRSLVKLNTVPPQAVSIEAMARQFWWQFSYPNAKVQGGVVANGNEMVMPTSPTPSSPKVAVTTSSMDVVHGFWAPNIGGQRASIPGAKKTWTVDTDKEAVFQGNCAQLCGASHANMRYKVVAISPERYDTFIKAATAYVAPAPAAGSAEERGMNIFMKGTATAPMACAACHRIQGTPAAGQSAPDLSFFGTRRTLGAGMWEAMTPAHWEEKQVVQKSMKVSPADALHAWIKHSPVVKPGSIMPRYDGGEYMVNGKMLPSGTLTDAEIDDIAAYLRSLKLPEEADYWKNTPISGEATAGGTQ